MVVLIFWWYFIIWILVWFFFVFNIKFIRVKIGFMVLFLRFDKLSFKFMVIGFGLILNILLFLFENNKGWINLVLINFFLY